MPYQAISGHDNVGTLVDLDPQPRSATMPRSPELVFYGSGAEFNGATYAELEWTALDRDSVDALLDQYGLSQTAASNDVTVSLRGRDDAFFNANATAIYLQTERLTPYGWEGFRIRYIHIEEIPPTP